MIGKIKGMRGSLYRKLKKKEAGAAPGTRAGLLLHSLRSRYGERYPKFAIYPVREFVTLPRPSEVRNVIYPVIRPYAYANIRYDEKENTLVYNVIEPNLDESEKKMLEKIKEGLVQVIDVSFQDVRQPKKMIEFLETSVQHIVDEYGFELSPKEYVKIMYYVYRDFIGLNRIEPLMGDPYIEDVGVDGVNSHIYVVHRKFGSTRTNIIYRDENELREFVIKLAERCGRYISYAEPLLDGTLTDGSRVQASLAQDVTTRGPTFSIRKFREAPFTPVDMIKLGTLDADMLAYLWFVVENGANILIVGGVSTGKTSLLNTLSMFIPEEAKIVSIEDTRELNIPHENWLPGVTRVGFTGTGVGEITMYELLRESFRQNPDYLIVGEVRGKEAYVMFQGMASGHPSISTMHAGSVDDVIKRLETRPINLSPGLLDSLDVALVMVHAREKGKSARRIKEIAEIESIDIDGTPHIVRPFVWVPADDTFSHEEHSVVLDKISRDKGMSFEHISEELRMRKRVIEWMYDNSVTDLHEVTRYVNLYRRNPREMEKILARKYLVEEK